MKKIIGTYCPLCGEMGLQLAIEGDELWAFCPVGAKGRKDAHTAFLVSPERVADLLPKQRTKVEKSEEDK